MFLTSALLTAALAQVPADSAAGTNYVTPASSSYADDWTYPEPVDSKWGFENFWPRFGLQHRSQGYGYDSGYTSFDTFVPLYQEDFSKLTAYQGSILLDNYGDFGYMGGLVQRHHVDSWQRVFGYNAFYNYREQGGNGFHQLGVGVETIGNYLDWRANGYIPLGDSFEIPDSGGGVTEAFFSGRSILVNFIADKPLAGFDTEVGGIIPGGLDVFRGYVGMYHFNGEYSDAVTGVQGRLEARFRDSGLASLAVTNDGTFGTRVVFGIGFWLPGNSPRNSPGWGRAAARMAEDVVRNQNIVIDRSATTDPVPARWLSGNQIDVVHINSAAAGAGTGTPTLPVQTLQEGQNLAGLESLLFVHANSSYNGESVVLQNGQQLLGEGVDHTINSLYGSFLLPTVTPPEDINNVPLINAAPGNAITLANNNVVSGFRINNSGGTGIFGNNISNVTLDRLSVNNAANSGIDLTGVSGNIQITENFVNNNGARGIHLSTSAAAVSNNIVVSDNTVLGNPLEGIEITTNGQSVNTLIMERNLVRVILGPLGVHPDPLVEITALNSSVISARVENNDIEDGYVRDNTSPDEDPYYHQFVVNAANNSRVDLGLINNRLLSDRQFLANNPRNGSFGVDLNSTDLAVLRARLDTNSSSLNYAFSENYISTMQLEDTLSTNTGTPYYFPTANSVETIPSGTIDLP